MGLRGVCVSAEIGIVCVVGCHSCREEEKQECSRHMEPCAMRPRDQKEYGTEIPAGFLEQG